MVVHVYNWIRMIRALGSVMICAIGSIVICVFDSMMICVWCNDDTQIIIERNAQIICFDEDLCIIGLYTASYIKTQ